MKSHSIRRLWHALAEVVGTLSALLVLLTTISGLAVLFHLAGEGLLNLTGDAFLAGAMSFAGMAIAVIGAFVCIVAIYKTAARMYCTLERCLR